MLAVQPISFDEACRFVAKRHRHHRPPQGYKLCLGVNDGERVVGVLIAGRPVARLFDDGLTLEVTRCCVMDDLPPVVGRDGRSHAAGVCSMLYSACWRATKALGYQKMITYTLPEEGGSSLRGSGAVLEKECGGGKWVKTIGGERVERANDWPLMTKFRWAWSTGVEVKRFAVLDNAKSSTRSLFDESTCDVHGDQR